MHKTPQYAVYVMLDKAREESEAGPTATRLWRDRLEKACAAVVKATNNWIVNV